MGKYDNTKSPQRPTQGQVMPSCPDIEEAVLGELMVDKDAFGLVKGALKQEYFYDRKNQLVFRAIEELHEADSGVDMLLVSQKMMENGSANDSAFAVDNAAYHVAKLCSNVSNRINLEYHARIVGEHYLKRTIIQLGSDLSAQAYDETNAAEPLIQKFKDDVSNIEKLYTPSRLTKFTRPMTMDEYFSEVNEASTGVETFIKVKGQGANASEEPLIIPSGELTFVCGLPGHGKSIFLKNLALFFASNVKGDVLYITLEEKRGRVIKQMLNCYINYELSKNNRRTIDSYYSTRGFDKFTRSGNSIDIFKTKEPMFQKMIESGKIRVYDDDLDCDEICNAIRLAARKTELSGIFIDYVQKIYINGTRLDRQKELKEICARLHKAAKDVNLPLVLAAQLNRESKSPIEMQPQNVADSAYIEREANVMILLWKGGRKPLNGSTYKADQTPDFSIDDNSQLYIRLAKNRDATPDATATLKCDYNKEFIQGFRAEEVTTIPVKSSDCPF